MRYLRMLTNSALAGAYAAAFVAVLVLQLNPALPLAPRVLAPLYGVMAAFYGLHLTVLFYLVVLVRQAFAQEFLSPGWLSLRLLAWFGTAVCGVAALLMWLNVATFEIVLDEVAARRMAAGAGATAVCALLLLVIAVVHYSFGRRGSRVGGTLFALTVVASLAFPLVARGPAAEVDVAARRRTAVDLPPAGAAPGRLHVVLLDGASLEYITLATAEGRLPNFGRMLDGGASMHLETIRPTQPGPVWAAALTGKYPSRNGVRSAARYGFGAGPVAIELLPDLCFAHALLHLGLLEEWPHDAAALRARPLWEVLSAVGVRVGFVGVPLSSPVSPVDGYLVSDRIHLADRAALPSARQTEVFPADAFSLEPLAALSHGFASGAATAGPPGLEPTARDSWYVAVARALETTFTPVVTVLRLETLDVAGHYFLRYAQPRAFGDVSDEERRRYGPVLDQHYAFVDAHLGVLIDRLGPDDVLMVVSGFGMEPVSLAKRLLARVLGEPRHTGTHEHGPDGFLLAYGALVAPGRLPVGTIVDVAPTILYYLGLPVGGDMDGYARTDAFRRGFTVDRPITFIRSYD